MNKKFALKSSAFCLGILFCVSSLATAVQANTTDHTDQSKLTQIIIETYTPNNKKIQSIWVSEQQLQEITSILHTFQTTLQNQKTTSETQMIFQDVLQSLTEYDVLSDAAKNRIINRFQHEHANIPPVIDNSNKIKLWHNTWDSNDEQYNRLCFIAARATFSFDFNIYSVLGLYYYLLMYVYEMYGGTDTIQYKIYSKLFQIFGRYGLFKPFRFLNIIYFLEPVSLFSCGMQGIKYDVVEPETISIYGFTGLKIIINRSNVDAFYIGMALSVGPPLF